jgi:uncharacterized membrane protein
LNTAMSGFQRYVLAGLLTFVPLWVTWFVFDIVLGFLARLGRPVVSMVAALLQARESDVADWLLNPWMRSILAVAITLFAFYGLGFAATRVAGRRLIEVAEAALERLPVVQTVYGSTRRLLEVLRTKPANLQRVVLISFPSPGMKAVGFVTRTFKDELTGRELAAVYVPTTPNPTSGYMEILPVEDTQPTDWTVDEAMSFIVTGGAVGPERIRYTRSNAVEDRHGRHSS